MSLYSLKDDREAFVSRRVVLPAHMWEEIEQEADLDHGNDVSLAVMEMFDQSRLYRAMAKIKPSPAMRMLAKTLKKARKS